MGKKARLKKEKRERQEKGLELEVKGRITEKPGIERFLLVMVHLGTYLSLFTPLVLSPKFYFPFVGPKSLFFMFFAEIVFFAWLFLAIVDRTYRPKLSLLSLAFILFLISLTLSTILSVDFSRSFWSKYERMTGLLMWFHLLGFFLAISSTFKRRADWRRIFIISTFVAILVSLAALLEKAGVKDFQFSPKAGATLGNTSFLGTYLLFNVFLAFYLLLSSLNTGSAVLEKKRNWLLIIYSLALISLALPVIYLEGARAALVSAFGGCGLLVLLWLSLCPENKKVRIIGKALLAISSLVVITALISLFLPGTFVHQKFISLTSQARFVNWEIAKKAFLERPLFGWGPETYDIAFTKFFHPCFFTPRCGGEIWFDRTHNIIFDTLVATGIVGFLTYLGLFAALLYILQKKYFKEKSLDFWTFAVFTTLPIAYFIQNLTVFDMATSLLMFILVLGFVEFLASSIFLRSDREEGKPQVVSSTMSSDRSFLWRGKKRWLTSFLLLVFFFSFFNFIIQPFRADALVIKALRAPDPSTRLAFYQKTLETSPLGKYQIIDFFAQHSREVLGKNFKDFSREEMQKELDFLIQELEKSKKESPLDFRITLQLAQVYNFYSLIDPEKLLLAEQYGQECLKLSPTNQQGYWALSQTSVYQKNFERALSLAQKAIDLEPNWLPAHQIAARIANFAGDQEKARAIIEEALKINPDWQAELQTEFKAFPEGTSTENSSLDN